MESEIEVTREQIEWWLLCQTRFFWDGSEWKADKFCYQSTASWIVQQAMRPNAEYAQFTEDWEVVATWTFRVLEALTDCNVQLPPRFSRTPKSWDHVKLMVQGVAQQHLTNQLQDGEPVSEDVKQVTSWLLREGTPFHIWCAYQRMQDEIQEFVSDSLSDWVAGGTADLTRTVDKAWSDVTRALQSYFTNLTRTASKGIAC